MALLRLSHDNFFKCMMNDLRVAKDFFTAHLPPAFLKKVKLDTLKLESGSVIDSALRAKHTDVLYQVKLENEQLAYLYLLVEHQSTSDPLMAFRLLHYIFQILDRHVSNHKSKSPLPLPLVYPLVFYNGKEVFSAKRDIFNLFGEQEALAREVFLKPFTLIDVSTMDDETLREHHWAALMEWCMRHSRERDFLFHIKQLRSLLENLDWRPRDKVLEAMINYILSGMETMQEAEQALDALREQIPSDLENEMTTIAEQLYSKGEAEGLLRGRQEGRQKGRQEGEYKGIAKGAKNMLLAAKKLKLGYSSQFIAQETGLSLEYIENLRTVIEE